MRHRGFTLVELSIVLVIIGLIVAGVMAGQNLVQQAKYRSVVSQVEAIRSTYQTFRLQYNALPGDMADAGSYWGANCADDASTCNGNGNRAIRCTSSVPNETTLFWKHLQFADMLPGTLKSHYTGYYGGSYQPGINVARTALGSSSHFRICSTNGVDNSLMLGKDRGNMINVTPPDGGTYFTGLIAYTIDGKMDDGLPQTGKVVSYGAAGGATGNCNVAGANQYPVSDSSLYCAPLAQVE